MSDGSLSQDEIDALLMGSDSFGSDLGGGSSVESTIAPQDLQTLGNTFKEFSSVIGSTLSGIMSVGVTVGEPRIEALSRDKLLGQLTEEVVEIKIDFNQGVSGVHSFLFSPADAVKIAGPMIGQHEIDLDGTAISAVGEAVSQLTGTQITALGDKVGKNFMTISPESQKIAKGLLTLGSESLVQLVYPVTIEKEGSLEMRELLSEDIAKDLIALIQLKNQTNSTDQGSMGQQPMMNQQQPMMNQQQPMMNQQQPMMNQQQPMMNQQQPMMNQQQPMMNQQQPMMNQQMMNQQMMGQAQMMGMMGGAPPNVQGIQYPEFNANISPSEQRNIGLLMDVSMELTVELGRTKWQIKDILGIGEGTIIELDKLAGEPTDILVNNNLIAKGEVVVIDENFGVRVTEIVSNLNGVGDN